MAEGYLVATVDGRTRVRAVDAERLVRIVVNDGTSATAAEICAEDAKFIARKLLRIAKLIETRAANRAQEGKK